MAPAQVSFSAEQSFVCTPLPMPPANDRVACKRWTVYVWSMRPAPGTWWMCSSPNCLLCCSNTPTRTTATVLLQTQMPTMLSPEASLVVSAAASSTSMQTPRLCYSGVRRPVPICSFLLTAHYMQGRFAGCCRAWWAVSWPSTAS